MYGAGRYRNQLVTRSVPIPILIPAFFIRRNISRFASLEKVNRREVEP